jgi:hypothetical protein
MSSDNKALRKSIAEAMQRVNTDRPRFHRWSDEHDLVTGVLIEARPIAGRTATGTPVVALTLRQADGSLISTLAYRYVQHLLGQARKGHGAQRGDVIAIKRGDLIDHGGRVSPFRDWKVEVVEVGPLAPRATIDSSPDDDPFPIFGGFTPTPVEDSDGDPGSTQNGATGGSEEVQS